MARDLDPQKLDAISILLAPLSALYYVGWCCYEAVYQFGLKRPMQPKVRVIVVGNLTVGGMGKTPTTLAVCQVLKELGYEPVISASGYGSPRSQAATLAPEGSLSASEWGDEPALMRWLAPSIPMIVGRRRTLAAEICAKHFPKAVLVMDDGYQHKPLRHHISILIDLEHASNPLVLPAGPYREPRSHRHRADFLLPGFFKLNHLGTRFLNLEGQEVDFDPQPVQVLTAIAKPGRLTHTLESNGFKILRAQHYPDHHRLDAQDLFKRLDPSLPVVVTSKDWVKIRERRDLSGWDFRIAHYRVTIEPAQDFHAALSMKLESIGLPV